VTLRPVELDRPDTLEAAFDALAEDRPDALMVLGDATLLDLRERIAALALQRRLAAISTYPELTATGGLVSYGTRRSEFYRRAAYYARKILDGVKPADLPSSSRPASSSPSTSGPRSCWAFRCPTLSSPAPTR
jgi:putative ABC transport system substrate-binding protein